MRTFIGIGFGNCLALDDFCCSLAKDTVFNSFKWVKAHNRHLTLHFIGDTDDVVLQKLKEILRRCVHFSPFCLTVKGFGCFQSFSHARVFWLGTNESVELQHLYLFLQNELQSMGFQTDAKIFTPHVTLARRNSDRPLSFDHLKISDLEREWKTIVVDVVVLYESRSTPNGVIYVPLYSIPLQG